MITKASSEPVRWQFYLEKKIGARLLSYLLFIYQSKLRKSAVYYNLKYP